MRKHRFGGYEFSGGSPEESATQILEWLRNPHRDARLIGYLNPRVFNESQQSAVVRQFLRGCDLIAIDGVGIVLAAALLQRERLPRAWMTGVFDTVLASPRTTGTALLIGASAPENSAAAEAISRLAPALHVAAGYDGYRDVGDYAELLHRHADVDLVLVGMGCPKSETVLLQARSICSRALCWNIGGGTVRYYAGAKRRPPRWVQRAGFQWLYRVLREPDLRRRYLVDIPQFARYSVRHRH